jgi:2-hydroxychromene-2-carboxylate isomerase
MKPRTRFRSTIMRVVASEGYQRFIRGRARRSRARSGEPPAVHYFHEVSDPYSHLAVQRLDALREKYSLTFHVHLVSAAAPAYRGDAARYDEWARGDAASIAAGFGVTFPDAAILPTAPAINEAANLLQNKVGDNDFARVAIETGRALWDGELEGVETAPDLSEGNALRAKLGHYAGAMFWFDGEWYWGLDRLDLLERRLIEEGFGTSEPLVHRPHIEVPAGCAKDLKLEVFPSLRSPYTAISFDRIMASADHAGVQIEIRPVMPMMMRGVKAPRRKALYILFDSAREARRDGVPFGKAVDPFGEPVKLGFSLYPFADQQGKGREYISRYLRAAWAEGLDITRPRALQRIIEDIGLSWQEAEPHLGGDEAEALLETNVQDMLAAGLWGVPSFRLSGGDTPPFSCWGQDRLWRIEQEIVQRSGGSSA